MPANHTLCRSCAHRAVTLSSTICLCNRSVTNNSCSRYCTAPSFGLLPNQHTVTPLLASPKDGGSSDPPPTNRDATVEIQTTAAVPVAPKEVRVTDGRHLCSSCTNQSLDPRGQLCLCGSSVVDGSCQYFEQETPSESTPPSISDAAHAVVDNALGKDTPQQEQPVIPVPTAKKKKAIYKSLEGSFEAIEELEEKIRYAEVEESSLMEQVERLRALKSELTKEVEDIKKKTECRHVWGDISPLPFSVFKRVCALCGEVSYSVNWTMEIKWDDHSSSTETCDDDYHHSWIRQYKGGDE